MHIPPTSASISNTCKIKVFLKEYLELKTICAWCNQIMTDTGDGNGSTLSVCDCCLEKLYKGEITLGHGFTSGRCVHCNIRYVWNDPIRLTRVLCPKCHKPLKLTSRLFRGPTEPLIYPEIHGPGRIPVGVKR
jgi:hypothetical protein